MEGGRLRTGDFVDRTNCTNFVCHAIIIVVVCCVTLYYYYFMVCTTISTFPCTIRLGTPTRIDRVERESAARLDHEARFSCTMCNVEDCLLNSFIVVAESCD